MFVFLSFSLALGRSATEANQKERLHWQKSHRAGMSESGTMCAVEKARRSSLSRR